MIERKRKNKHFALVPGEEGDMGDEERDVELGSFAEQETGVLPAGQQADAGAAKTDVTEELDNWDENEEDWEDEEEDDEEEDSDDEFDGVDEEGMARLMKALGKGGLDDFDEAQLNSLHGDDSDDDEEDPEATGEAEDDNEDEPDSDEEQEQAPKASSSRSLADSIKALVGNPESDSDSESEEDAEEDEEAIALDEADDSVDEDAIPKRKVEIDNTVRMTLASLAVSLTYRALLDRIGTHTRDHCTGSFAAMDRNLGRDLP